MPIGLDDVVSGPKAWLLTAQGQALLRSFELAFASIEALERQWVAAQARVAEAEAEFGAERVHVSMERPRVLGQTRKVTLDQANSHLLALRAAVERLDRDLEREIQRNRRAPETAAAEAAALRDRAGAIVADLMADIVHDAPAVAAPGASEKHATDASAPRGPRPTADEEHARGGFASETDDTTKPLEGLVLDRVVGRLAPEVPERVRAAILALAAERADDAFVMDARLTEVRRRVQEANAAAKRWPSEEEALHLLLLQVRAFDSAAAQRWARALETALADRAPLEADDRAAVEAFVLEESAAEERRMVQYAVEETLGELGYEVGGAFGTLFVEGGSVFVQRPSWGEYFVRWRVDDERGEVNTNVVRAPGENDESSVDRPRRDREIEEAWCGDVARLREALAARGVHASLTRATPAGELPVPLLRTSPAEAAAVRSRQVRRRAALKSKG
jgi:hypothetical protein